MIKKILTLVIIAIIFYFIGHLSSRFTDDCFHKEISLASASLAVFPKPEIRADGFLSYGKFYINGVVIKTMKNDAPWEDFSSCIIVHHDERYSPNNYEIFHDRGLYLVHVRGNIIRSSHVTMKNAFYGQGIKVGDIASIKGEYGEYGNSSGSTTSLSNLGLFIVSPSEVKFTANQSPLDGR